jgi:hypothetical protein
MNELAQGAFIGAIAIGGIKTTKAAAAQCAAAFFIQRIAILKWRSATSAEELGVERLRFAQAAAAYRNSRNLVERAAADAAIVGKEKGKKGVRD